jgi:hypothetical protein
MAQGDITFYDETVSSQLQDTLRQLRGIVAKNFAKFTKDAFSLLQPTALLYTSCLTKTECGRSSGVEHNLAKVRVGRSNRLARSSFGRLNKDL